MPTDLPKNIIKLIIALLKHQAENVLGKEAIGIAGKTFVEIGGEKAQGQIDAILNTNEGTQKLVDAALRADVYFREKCTDQDLRDAFTIPVGDLPSVQAMLKELPSALDQENALDTLRNNLTGTFPNLKKNQIEYGASLYLDCLNRALLPLKDFTLLIIGHAVLESKADIQESKADIKEIKAMVEDVLQRITLQQLVIAEIQPPTPEFDPDILDDLNAPGGALKISDQFYVERNADDIIKRHIIKEGSTIIIRASHQTGKSSLLARGIHHANSKANIVHINLQGFEHRELEIADTFYKHFARIINKKLKIDNSIVDQIWRLDLSSQSKLNELMEEYILPGRNQRIILAIDEAECVNDLRHGN